MKKLAVVLAVVFVGSLVVSMQADAIQEYDIGKIPSSAQYLFDAVPIQAALTDMENVKFAPAVKSEGMFGDVMVFPGTAQVLAESLAKRDVPIEFLKPTLDIVDTALAMAGVTANVGLDGMSLSDIDVLAAALSDLTSRVMDTGKLSWDLHVQAMTAQLAKSISELAGNGEVIDAVTLAVAIAPEVVKEYFGNKAHFPPIFKDTSGSDLEAMQEVIRRIKLGTNE